MGCYAAIHGLKMADQIVKSDPSSRVLVVCTELCSLHYQKTFTENTLTAPLIFGDGSAAVLVCADDYPKKGIRLNSFHSEVMKEAKDSMTWDISATGFVMTLSAEIPGIFKADIGKMSQNALAKAGFSTDDIKYWCIHPGGKRILEAISHGLNLTNEDMASSFKILREYGNMSSATILFVLKDIWEKTGEEKGAPIFGVAFGPGLTMESLVMAIV